MEVMRPGTQVEFKSLSGESRICGTVAAVWIDGEALAVSYRVSWWNGRSRQIEWIPDHELEPTSPADNLPIGFTNGGRDD